MSSIEKDGWLYSMTSLSSGGQREARRGQYSAWWDEDGECHTDWPHKWGRPEWPADFDPQVDMAWTGFRA